MKTRFAMLLPLLLIACADPGRDESAVAADGEGSTQAGSPGKPGKLGLCVACHGESGRSRIAAAPHIGGQNPVYLVWALNQYKAGKREGDVMNAVVGALNDRDIEALAEWYAAQPCNGVSGS